MYFKVKPNSDTHRKIDEYFEKEKDARERLKVILDEIGAKRYAVADNWGFRTFAFEFKEKPKGFKIYNKHRNLYTPRKNNPLNLRLESLGYPRRDDLNKILGFIEGQVGRAITMNAGIFKADEVYYVTTGNGSTDNSDLIEILTSEYLKAKGE